jgi:hypothetical protein
LILILAPSPFAVAGVEQIFGDEARNCLRAQPEFCEHAKYLRSARNLPQAGCGIGAPFSAYSFVV